MHYLHFTDKNTGFERGSICFALSNEEKFNQKFKMYFNIAIWQLKRDLSTYIYIPASVNNYSLVYKIMASIF